MSAVVTRNSKFAIAEMLASLHERLSTQRCVGRAALDAVTGFSVSDERLRPIIEHTVGDLNSGRSYCALGGRAALANACGDAL
jgi:hypothetical protein